MIKIEPFFAADSIQMRALLRYQDEPVPYESFCAEERLSLSGWTFFQHWLPCRWHIAPAVYVAKEDGVILALISITSVGKARTCWRINHLVVHPQHRGRGIASELLRYVFALFGSQGVSHFVAEISCQNTTALSLLGSCGFRRSARVVHYQLKPEKQSLIAPPEALFRLAQPGDEQALYQLHQDALPPDLRRIYELQREDFDLSDEQIEITEKTLKRLTKSKVWYWVLADKERQVLTASLKVLTHRGGDYHMEFAIHPGWAHVAKQAAQFAVTTVRRLAMKGVIIAKAYDYQPAMPEALAAVEAERSGEFFLMTREHWLRAKKPRSIKLESRVNIPSIGKPAINMPRQ